MADESLRRQRFGRATTAGEACLTSELRGSSSEQWKDEKAKNVELVQVREAKPEVMDRSGTEFNAATSDEAIVSGRVLMACSVTYRRGTFGDVKKQTSASANDQVNRPDLKGRQEPTEELFAFIVEACVRRRGGASCGSVIRSQHHIRRQLATCNTHGLRSRRATHAHSLDDISLSRRSWLKARGKCFHGRPSMPTAVTVAAQSCCFNAFF